MVEVVSKADRYLEASVRENTSKSYAAALAHFEVTWGGFLPTTTESVVRYIAEYADPQALSTLKQRLAALANWHQSNRKVLCMHATLSACCISRELHS